MEDISMELIDGTGGFMNMPVTGTGGSGAMKPDGCRAAEGGSSG